MEEKRVLENLRDNVIKELTTVANKGTFTPNEVETTKNAVCLIKEIDEVLHGKHLMPETSEGRHHMGGYSYGYYDPYIHGGMHTGGPGRMYSYGDEYMMDHHSMARGRDAVTGRYVSRDGMDTSGRRYTFSYETDPEWNRHHDRDEYTNTSGRRYSSRRDGGYSGHSIDDRIVDMLEKMMDSATSNYERNKLNTIIRVVDSMRGE